MHWLSYLCIPNSALYNRSEFACATRRICQKTSFVWPSEIVSHGHPLLVRTTRIREIGGKPHSEGAGLFHARGNPGGDLGRAAHTEAYFVFGARSSGIIH